MFSKILVPIDGSPTSYRGLQCAVDVAKKYGAEITLMHVIEQPTYGFSGSVVPSIPEKVYADLERFSEELLAKRTRELTRMGVRTRTLVKRGNPSDEVLNVSRDFDLIVMGSRGVGGFKKLLLGSVSSKVAFEAPCTVTLVRPPSLAASPASEDRPPERDVPPIF